jgi:hypothetical protein
VVQAFRLRGPQELDRVVNVMLCVDASRIIACHAAP